MKTLTIVVIFVVAGLIDMGSHSIVTESGMQQVRDENKQAFECYSACKKLADEWLPKLDSTNFNNLLSIRLIRDQDRLQAASWIADVRIKYGRVTQRKFLGAHIWHNEKLLTYAPDVDDHYLTHINATKSDDGFYVVDARYFGLSSHKQMFAGIPEGDYVILMYEDVTKNQPHAEEKLTFWHNPKGGWEVVGYNIAEDI